PSSTARPRCAGWKPSPALKETNVQFKKAPPNMVELFHSALPDDAAVNRRQMFGYPCAFVNGNMFSGLFADSMFVRLGDEQRQQLLAVEGAATFAPMANRPMKEYVVLPESILGDGPALRDWVKRSFAFAASLPPKSPRPRRSKKGGR